ncbi:MAG: four-carbon acid sugar kinase family protein [Chloroflexi bacterium]|uniref:four-carbon acid sugar kinase family protein n=1 Tax=Candidatus Flexifilum breve TaxID=3140694 RepID=UPI003135E585|nr:four-carbon acid sugar kinase family protein [Chloroflexota bacterium]
MIAAARLALTFYGDDFTGSTDVMEVLEWAGVPTLLFLEPPTPELLAERFPHIRAVGVAGVSRSLSPQQMETTLPPIFAALTALGAQVFHYKICSTFDSSPTIGSIGRATDIGVRLCGEQTVPLLVGAPFLRRYVAFSNLFARIDDTTYRLDRHPVMSKHPMTPMHEADLRLHLGEQTQRRIAAMNVLHLSQPADTVSAYWQALEADGAEIVVFDTIDDGHLLTIGALLQDLMDAHDSDQPLFVVGSSGVQRALTLHWQHIGRVAQPPPPPPLGAVNQLIIVSGSAAPPTAAQIDWAENNGFVLLRLDSARLVDPECADTERTAVVRVALEHLGSGRSVLLFSARGPDDPHIASTKAHLAELALDPNTVGSRLGTQQGLILRELLEKTELRRAVVTGGDTCGYAARQLGIYALGALTPVAPGAPICRAYSADPRFDGLEISLKAGQVGKVDYFGSILRGSQ